MITLERDANAVVHRVIRQPARRREAGVLIDVTDRANSMARLENVLRSRTCRSIAGVDATTRGDLHVELDAHTTRAVHRALPLRERSFNDRFMVDRRREAHSNHPFNSF
jgi:hypothetical protein